LQLNGRVRGGRGVEHRRGAVEKGMGGRVDVDERELGRPADVLRARAGGRDVMARGFRLDAVNPEPLDRFRDRFSPAVRRTTAAVRWSSRPRDLPPLVVANGPRYQQDH